MIASWFRRKESRRGAARALRLIRAARRTLACSRCRNARDRETLMRIHRLLDEMREETFYAEFDCRFHAGGPESIAPLPHDDPPPPWARGA